MANLVENPGAETGSLPPWTGSATATVTTDKVYAGSYAFRLNTLWGFPGGPQPVLAQVLDAVPGVDYPVRAYVNADDAGSPPSGAAHNLVCRVLEGDPPSTLLHVVKGWATFPAGWSLVEFGNAVPTTDEITIQLSTTKTDPPLSSGGRPFYVDDVELFYPDQPVMRSNIEQLLTNVDAVITGLDPNIGAVFKAKRWWTTTQQIDDDGAVITIDTTGLFDDAADFGRATRFWIIEPHTEIVLSTNCTDTFRHRLRVTGFFSRQSAATEDSIRKAVEELLDKLGLHATEFTDLAASMGAGYLGFLTERPNMSGPVLPAALQSGGRGYTGQITLAVHEELDR